MIIGLSGYARSGKNTVADMLGEEYRQVSFAEPMREALYKLNPILGKDSLTGGLIQLKNMVDAVGWDMAKELSTEVRRLLQVLGTEVGREMFGENFWVNIAMTGIDSGDNVVFTDVRFPNEAWAISRIGGQVWRVNREGVEAVNTHPSEHALDGWDFDRVINNNGTLNDLRRQINELQVQIMEK